MLGYCQCYEREQIRAYLQCDWHLGAVLNGNAAAYCASKCGVVKFSKGMADELKRFGIKFTWFDFGGINPSLWNQVSLRVDRSKKLRSKTAANTILFTRSTEPQAVALEVNSQPDSHLFF